MTEAKNMQFDRPRYLRLLRVYRQAVDDGRESFKFEGGEFLVSYAKYLLEFLAERFK